MEDGPWLRIFAFSGLQNQRASQNYMTSIRSRVIQPVAAGLRAIAQNRSGHAGADAVELAWAIHGELCFGPICNRLLGLQMARLTSEEIRRRIEKCLLGRLPPDNARTGGAE
ncbi:hypothetical protein [Roseomonas sp. WA12]